MPNRDSHDRLNTTHTAFMAAYLDDRENELLDNVVSAAALVARADGSVALVERGQLLDFLDRSGFMSVFTRDEIFDAFARRVCEVEEPGGLEAAVDRLRRVAGGSSARLILDACEEIAAADCRLDPRERHILNLIRVTLGTDSLPSARSPHLTGRAE
jgi:tellurite resistance protein